MVVKFRILVTGASGQVGQQLVKSLNDRQDFVAIAKSHQDLDICDSIEVLRVITTGLDAVVNCAAYTAVDLAQSNAPSAWSINVEGPKQLAKACALANIPLLHYSSDYVYDNGQTTPYSEADPCNPKSIYAISKYLGEQEALYHHARTVVIRTSWVYADQGQNFVNTILKLAKEKSNIKVVNDQIGAPTYTPDLVQATIKILSSVLEPSEIQAQYGIYNFANQGVISWFDFASEIIKISGLACVVEPVPSTAYPRPAPRPQYSVFNLAKIKHSFDPQIPFWQDSLAVSLRSPR